jgi:type IX secretion system PorP/SprF family membrane protein
MKNKIVNTKCIVLSLTSIFFISGFTKAQDAQFSQYSAVPILLNPASTGMMSFGDMRFGGQYRSQWSSLTSNFVTTALSFDMPLQEKFGVGAYVINTDEYNVISTFNFVASGAYSITQENNTKYKLSVGLQAGLIYKKLNPKVLTYDQQYQDGFFDTALPNGENFQNLDRIMPEFNAGISYYNYYKVKRFKPYASATVQHISSPNQSLVYSEKSKLPIRWIGQAGARIKMSEAIILDPSVLFMRQRTAQQINAGCMVNYIIKGTSYEVLGGLNYRLQDAAVVQVGFKHNFNIFRISYDFNVSDLSYYSHYRGGVEFSLQYTPGKRRNRAIY